MSKLLLTLSAVSLILSGCASYSPIGLAYTSGTTGLTANNNVKSTLRGEACVKSFVSLFTFGDASIDAAKHSAGITKVATVDYDVMNVLGVYGEYCTVVKGE